MTASRDRTMYSSNIYHYNQLPVVMLGFYVAKEFGWGRGGRKIYIFILLLLI